MNSKNSKLITPFDSVKNHDHAVIFPVKGHLALIHSLPRIGFDVIIDPKCQSACAIFNNSHEKERFQKKILITESI